MYFPKDVVREPLYVITTIFNPVRYKQRWKLYRDFAKRVRDAGAILITVEASFGEREAALEDHAPTAEQTHDGNYQSFGPVKTPPSPLMPPERSSQDYIKVQVDDSQEIWLKENCLNIGVQHLPPKAKYVAFVDSDINFARPDWVSETIHALQHYDVVQMFSTAINLSPEYMPLECNLGYVFCHLNNYPRKVDGDYYCQGSKGHPNAWHTGFAWAWRRSSLNKVGGLIDTGVLGAGDNHMARALVGRVEESLNSKLSDGYKRPIRQWQVRCDEFIKQNIGYIDGLILHYWHGQIKNRRYGDRWRILIEHNFDPDTDMYRDARGMLKLHGNKPKFRDDVRRYFRSRNEDSIDCPSGEYRITGAKPEWVAVHSEQV